MNLIVNYQSKNIPFETKKPKPDFNIQQELDNRTFIKPLNAKGKLLDDNILNAPADMVKNFAYNVKSFKHALSGKANDHEIGKMNDVGMFLGGLGIAGYLATRRQTPLTKGMEFIGLGSFLASMAIWPKIAIQLPAYLIHGVNVHKQYEDSFGRKKPFYQDPQFIPWDLYSDEEINKIGDKLGVSSKIPNRRDLIQEKMRKLAVQNNTLWMLTAGFATPVMSALICNQIEPHIDNYLTRKEIKEANKILSDIDNYSKKYYDGLISRKIDEIYKSNKDKPLDEALVKRIVDTFTENMDSVTGENLQNDLRFHLLKNKYKLSEQSAGEIAQNLKDVFPKGSVSSELLESILPEEKDIKKIFDDGEWFKKELTPDSFREIDSNIIRFIREKIDSVDLAKFNEEKSEFTNYVKETILGGKIEEHPVKKVLSKIRAAIFDEKLFSKLKDAGRIFSEMQASIYSFDDYVVKKTSVASKKSSIDMLDLFGITSKDLEKIKFSEDLVGKMLRERMETIVTDEVEYPKFIEKIVKKIEALNDGISKSDMEFYNEKVTIKFTEFAKQLKDFNGIDFSDTVRAIVSNNIYTSEADLLAGNVDLRGTLLKVQKDFLSEKMLGMKSTYMRLISSMDLFKRVVTSANTFLKNYPREIREEIVELCKTIALNGHMSDFATKFYMKRNPNPNMDDMSDIEISKGKVKYKYFGKTQDTVNIPTDKYFYQNSLRFLYEAPMDEETLKVVNKSVMKKDIINWREKVFDTIGSDKYFARLEHITTPPKLIGSKYKFLLIGVCPQENFFKNCQNTLNTKKWLKIFGTFGAVLFGATILAQFFLGRIKPAGGKRD